MLLNIGENPSQSMDLLRQIHQILEHAAVNPAIKRLARFFLRQSHAERFNLVGSVQFGSGNGIERPDAHDHNPADGEDPDRFHNGWVVLDVELKNNQGRLANGVTFYSRDVNGNGMDARAKLLQILRHILTDGQETVPRNLQSRWTVIQAVVGDAGDFLGALEVGFRCVL